VVEAVDAGSINKKEILNDSCIAPIPLVPRTHNPLLVPANNGTYNRHFAILPHKLGTFLFETPDPKQRMEAQIKE
jgi:hypothetical protein